MDAANGRGLVETIDKPLRLLVLVALVLGLLVPLGAYYVAIGRVPRISASKALVDVAAGDAASALVDIRGAAEFEEFRVRGSVNWPLAEILGLEPDDGLPEGLAGKELRFLCDSGLLVVLSQRKVVGLGLAEAVIVDDGLAAFNVIDGVPIDAERMRGVYAGRGPVPYRVSPWYEQWPLFLTGFVVKPLHMLLSLGVVLALRRQRALDLAALRWGMAAFLFGESACAVNYIVFGEQSHLAEYLHCYGMLVAFAFITYAVLEGLDRRVIHLSAAGKKCAFLSLCPSCGKKSDGVCGVERVFKMLLVTLLVAVPISFCSRPSMVSYNTRILLSAYNFSHAAVYQIYESRCCPAMAMFFLGWSLVVLVRGRDGRLRLAKVLFSAGMGAFGFGVFRVILFGLFKDNLVWFSCWEEITELILAGAVAYVLFVFRGKLLAGPA